MPCWVESVGNRCFPQKWLLCVRASWMYISCDSYLSFYLVILSCWWNYMFNKRKIKKNAKTCLHSHLPVIMCVLPLDPVCLLNVLDCLLYVYYLLFIYCVSFSFTIWITACTAAGVFHLGAKNGIVSSCLCWVLCQNLVFFLFTCSTWLRY